MTHGRGLGGARVARTAAPAGQPPASSQRILTKRSLNPQDIEGVVDADGKVTVVQTRPQV